MSFFKLENGKQNYLSWFMVTCLCLWVVLFATGFCIQNGAERISKLAAQIEFGVNIATIIFSFLICKNLSKKDDGYKEMAWLFAINIILFIVNICFYFPAYASGNFLLQLSIIQFLLYYFPCILACFIMIIFLSRVVLKDILHTNNFLKVVAIFIVMDIICFSSDLI